MSAVWRSFKFFNAELLKSPLCHMELTCCCSGQDLVFAGDSDGMVRVVDRSKSNEGVKYEFRAYRGPVLCMKYVRSRNVLVTIGDDDNEQDVCIVRVWSFAPLVTAGVLPNPPPCNEHRLFSARYPPPKERVPLGGGLNLELTAPSSSKIPESAAECSSAVSVSTFVVSFDVSDDLRCAAVALVGGEIVLIHDDLERRRAVNVQRLHSSVSKGLIAFVGFTPHIFASQATPGKKKHQPLLSLSSSTVKDGDVVSRAMYTVFSDCVTVWHVSAVESKEYRCEPTLGATPGCCCMTAEGQLIVASAASDQMAVYGNEAVGSHRQPQQPSPQFDWSQFGAVHVVEVPGRKQLVVAHRSYVLVLAQCEAWSEKLTLQCYDLYNRLRCLSRSQEGYCTNVAWVVAGASDILIFCREPPRRKETSGSAADGGNGSKPPVSYQVVRLEEIALQERLQQLFQKECYEIAQCIACRSQTAEDEGRPKNKQLLEIKKHYGDYLVSKRDYAGAVKQYVDAIGHVEPSYVIRVFVDAQQVVPLTQYLEELHSTRHNRPAHRSHTTLLLCCYVHLHDGAKLSDFIHRNDVHLDPRTAIDVCTDAGYYEAALYLAEKYAQPHDYVTMQLDYLHNPTRALEFVQTLCLDDAEEILREQQGKRIISALPRRGTEVFIKLCVRWCGPARRLSDGSQPSKEPGLKHPNRSDAKQFLHVFADFPVCLLHFLRSVVESGVLDGEDPGKEVVLYNTLLELYITRELKHDIREGAVASDPAEMFAVEPYEQRRQQALAFLAEFSGRYDAYHALLLAQQHNFEEGVFLLLRRQRHSTELLQYHAKGLEDSVPSMIRQAVKDRLIDFCLSSASDGETGGDAATGAEGDSKGGKSARELWMSLLSMLACGSESDSGDIGRVLSHIAAQDALSPLSVLTTLSSSNADLQLHTFRDYVLGMMQREEARRESIERRTDARLKELQDLHDELDTMQTEAIILQAYNCSHCGAALDLPAVYFACHHSFHRRCLSDVTKCNLCSGAIARARDINQWQQPQRRVKGDFFQYLNSVKYEEGFEMVVEQFGSGIFGPREDPHSPSGVAASAVALACDDSVYDESGELLKPEAVERW